ncbi:hypothetical protein chiPu_0032732 [Chiloscyllium punctatum]|uniref:Uncharacterized protein n=1 Tax=Chiloscyllium punctatum TaxID=137246 RepID=A0A401U0Y3_CHIPU|nr:hypothetical protein [Chiloscyllium punctatum]
MRMQDSALQLRGASTCTRWPSISKVMPVPPACADVVAISSAAIATSFFIWVSVAWGGVDRLVRTLRGRAARFCDPHHAGGRSRRRAAAGRNCHGDASHCAVSTASLSVVGCSGGFDEAHLPARRADPVRAVRLCRRGALVFDRRPPRPSRFGAVSLALLRLGV